LEADDRKEHVLENVQHHSNAGREELRPHRKVKLAFHANIDTINPTDETTQNQRRDKLTSPGDRGGVERELEIIRLRGVLLKIEREVGVDILVRAKVEDEDAAKEGGHGDVFGEEADKDVASADLLIGGVGLRGESESSNDPVPEGGHGDGGENDEDAG